MFPKSPLLFQFILLLLFLFHPSSQTIHTISPNGNMTLQYLTGKDIAKGNDIIEYESGTYSTQRIDWYKSMPDNAPITIRAKEGANVIFDCSGSTESYVVGFDVPYASNYKIIGPFTVKNCNNVSIRVLQGHNVLISNFTIYNSYNWAVMASGNNVIIENNYIKECVTNNKGCTSQWKQCIASEAYDDTAGTLSKNIIIRNNTIINSYGEVIDITFSENALVSNNTIIDFYPTGIYVDNGRNVIIEKNIVIKRDAKTYCEKYWYNFIGYQVATETWGKTAIPIYNITIKNNFAWGCFNGVGFFVSSSESYYVSLNIVHNTFYNIKNAAVYFGEKALKTPSKNQVKNNFFMSGYNNSGIFINKEDQHSWDIGGNIYYGCDKVGIPDTVKINNKDTSTAFSYNTSIKMFFNNSNCSLESYNSSDIDLNCYIPDNNSILYHNGIQTDFSDKDYLDFIRYKTSPTIGMFEGEIVENNIKNDTETETDDKKNNKNNKSNYAAVTPLIIVIIICGIIFGLFIYLRKRNKEDKIESNGLSELIPK